MKNIYRSIFDKNLLLFKNQSLSLQPNTTNKGRIRTGPARNTTTQLGVSNNDD